MKFTLRAKLIFMAVLTTLSFVTLTVVGSVLNERASRHLAQLQQAYVPMLELGPRLDAEFENLRRGLHDAVAAQDLEALAAVGKTKDILLANLANDKQTAGAPDLPALQAAINDYYKTADDVARRFIAQETGEAIVGAMTVMQAQQAVAEQRLNQFTKVDRDKLALTFKAIHEEMNTLWKWRTTMSLSCMLIVVSFSIWIGHSVLISLRELSAGLDRFGKGDFSHPVGEVGNDELSEVAARANRMSERLNGLMQELSAFSYSVAHDLRAPLRSIVGFSDAVIEDYSAILPAEGRAQLTRVKSAAKKMGELIDSLLGLSRLARQEMNRATVDLSALAGEVMSDLLDGRPSDHITTVIASGMTAQGDQHLLRIVLVNLLGNALKFSGKKDRIHIEVGVESVDGKRRYFVKDNGAGFDMQYSNKLFGTFQRLHLNGDFEGTGIGLATVQRIIHRHGGKISAVAKEGQGATFYFTLE